MLTVVIFAMQLHYIKFWTGNFLVISQKLQFRNIYLSLPKIITLKLHEFVSEKKKWSNWIVKSLFNTFHAAALWTAAMSGYDLYRCEVHSHSFSRRHTAHSLFIILAIKYYYWQNMMLLCSWQHTLLKLQVWEKTKRTRENVCECASFEVMDAIFLIFSSTPPQPASFPLKL